MHHRVVRGKFLGILVIAGWFVCAPVPSQAQDVGEALRSDQTLTSSADLETAFLPPNLRRDSFRDDPAELPRILSEADVRRYKEIFRLQDEGKLKAVDRVIRSLEDRILMGHVQAQRFLHPTAYRSTWRDLRGWLALYADHPDADRIDRLAMKRKPADAAEPTSPVGGYLGGNGADAVVDVTLYVSPRKRTSTEQAAIRSLKRDLRRLIRSGRPSAALTRLARPDAGELLDSVE